jgi:orotate phosphoribosyltransferase
MDIGKTLKECGAFKVGTFILTSGKESKYYIDIKQASTDPRILREIAKQMATHMAGESRIAGMELGAVPLAVALALETGLPYLIIRKNPRSHGTGKLIEGQLQNQDSVILVEDVTTSGSSVVRAAEIIRKAGGRANRVLVVVDREEGAPELLKEHDLELIPLVTAGQMMH